MYPRIPNEYNMFQATGPAIKRFNAGIGLESVLAGKLLCVHSSFLAIGEALDIEPRGEEIWAELTDETRHE